MLDKDKLLPGKRMNDLGRFARREAKNPDLQVQQESKTWIHPPSSGQTHWLLHKPPKPPGSNFKTSTHTRRFLFPVQFYAASPYIIICSSSLNCLLHSCVVSCHYSVHKLLCRWIFFFPYLPARRVYRV